MPGGRGPCERRDGVDDKADVLYISRFFGAIEGRWHAIPPGRSGNGQTDGTRVDWVLGAGKARVAGIRR